MNLGPVVPFDAALIVLAVGGGIVSYTWTENYGDATSNASLGAQMSNAMNTITTDKKVFLLGAMQALFEGSMYTFVFLWTPALSPNGEDIPHGFIFASFMLACMLGSSIAAKLMTKQVLPIEKYMQYVFALSAVALMIPVWFHGATGVTKAEGGGISFDGKIQLMGFLLFEICVGIFWPSIMSMRSKYIPEECRSTIMNIFRIPLNIFVCIVLYNVSAFPMENMFAMCAFFLAMCAVCQHQLCKVAAASGYVSVSGKEMA